MGSAGGTGKSKSRLRRSRGPSRARNSRGPTPMVSSNDSDTDTRTRSESADRRISLRIGVHVGDVIVEGEDRHGDAVNVAARLQQLAEPGGICVSRTVVDHVKQKVAVGFDNYHNGLREPSCAKVKRLIDELERSLGKDNVVRKSLRGIIFFEDVIIPKGADN